MEDNILWFFCNNCKNKETVAKNTVVYKYKKL